MIIFRYLFNLKFFSVAFLSLGIFLLMQVILPFVSFRFWEIGQNYSGAPLISPKKSDLAVLGISVKNNNNFPQLVSTLKRETIPSYNSFSITVPTLNLEKETVFVDSNDLSQGLAQLPGSALPGEKGNLFISGHSAISRFLGGQKAVFAKLTDLKKGDEIKVEAGNTKFTYKVVEIKTVDPADLSVIAPPDELGRYISLMTCVPPGLNFKRLIVLGKMV